MSKKEDEVIAKVREKQPDLSPHEEERIRRSVRSIEANPHVCKKCWSGDAYFNDRLICDCWSDDELSVLEAKLAADELAVREVKGVRYYTNKVNA